MIFLNLFCNQFIAVNISPIGVFAVVCFCVLFFHQNFYDCLLTGCVFSYRFCYTFVFWWFVCGLVCGFVRVVFLLLFICLYVCVCVCVCMYVCVCVCMCVCVCVRERERERELFSGQKLPMVQYVLDQKLCVST